MKIGEGEMVYLGDMLVFVLHAFVSGIDPATGLFLVLGVNCVSRVFLNEFKIVPRLF